MANRTPRESTTRERTERSMEWRPGSALEAPKHPSVISTVGFVNP